MNIIKRNGSVEQFSLHKIETAIKKAALSVGAYDKRKTKELAKKVEEKLQKFGKNEVHVEEIQNLVEETLMEAKEFQTARAYIIYRQKRAEVRRLASSLGVTNDLKLDTSPLIVLVKRYLLKDSHGKIKETPKGLFRRVARTIAGVEAKYGASQKEIRRLARDFYNLMTEKYFLPNSPTLMNAGTEIGVLSACFVLPIEDSLDSIFKTLHATALIHKAGGGTGFDFSKLRPAGDVVKTTGGVSSGPVSFMKVYDAATNSIKQGGRRRGANMGVLHVTHPDILEFITCKTRGGLDNFNISVGVTDQFMRGVEGDGTISLVNPRTKEPVQTVPCRAIFDLITTEAWKSGDPGLIFLDTINRSNSNPVPKFGPITATNPCGELPLYPYESCNLGSINLSKFAKPECEEKINWSCLEKTVRLAVRFLDNVIDANKYPLQEIEEMTKKTRRIGLGVMGWADLLIELGIKYDSEEALQLAHKIMKFITEKARDESVKLGEERGSFPEFQNSIWVKRGYKAMRNAAVTCVPPTGTVSILAECSPSIEPLFSIVTIRELEESLGARLIDVNKQFLQAAIKEGFYSDELIKKVSSSFSIQHIKEIPEHVRRVFVTAHDISPEWHVKTQAAFQAYTDNAVSKTVNLPQSATPHDVERIFLLAWKLGCKGITIFRTGCKDKQVFVCSECTVENS